MAHGMGKVFAWTYTQMGNRTRLLTRQTGLDSVAWPEGDTQWAIGNNKKIVAFLTWPSEVTLTRRRQL